MNDAGKIMIVPKGNYQDTVKYEKLDSVTHNGSAWIAIQDTIGNEPTESSSQWIIFVRGGMSVDGDTISMDTNNVASVVAIKDAIDNKILQIGITVDGIPRIYFNDNDETQLSGNEVENLLATDWDGSSDADEDALQSNEMDTLLATDWDGSSDADEDALQADEIAEILK